jgi:hypothetical protein
MTRAQLLSALLAAGTLAAGSYYIATDTTVEALAYADCALAKADVADGVTVDCVEGPVAVRIKLSADSDQTGYEIIPGTEVEVGRTLLDKPEVQPLVSDCVAGELRRDTSSKGDGSQWWYPPATYDGQCERARLQCRLADKQWVSVAEGITAGACIVIAPQEFAGRPTWQARLAEERPETALVGEVGP